MESITFGSLPPLLSNLQWVPTVDEPDTNVSFIGDVNFCSGIKFHIKSFINVNWPREKYASIPIVIDLEILQVTGRFKFSVDIDSSHLCFLDEPDVRLASYFEAGDQFKVKGIPLVSDYVIKKVRKFIRTKLIYPNTHKFRLIWPRNWWPDNTTNSDTATTTNNDDDIKVTDNDINTDINNKFREFAIMNKTKIFDEKIQILLESLAIENSFVASSSSSSIKRCLSSSNITNDVKSKISIKRDNTINDFRSNKIKDVILSHLHHNSTIIGTTATKTKPHSPTTIKRLAAKGKNILDKFWTKIDKVSGGSTSSSNIVGGSGIGINNDEEKNSSLLNDNDDPTDSKSKSMVSIFKSKLSATKDTLKKVVKEQLDKRRPSLKTDEI